MSGRRICTICGAPVPEGRRAYCSAECQKEAERRRSKAARQGRARSGAYHWMTCPDCGAVVWRHVKCVRCEACQAAAKDLSDSAYRARRASGAARKIGEQYPCEACGEPYVLTSGKQRYCPRCAPHEVAENIRAQSRAWYRDAYGTPEGKTKKAEQRSRKAVPVIKSCAKCGREFETSSCAIYCSDACRQAALREQYRAYNQKRKKKNGGT